MKLKLTLILALCSIAMAQDFHGVALGGDTLQPILINHSDQTVIAYVTQRDTTTGVSSDPLPTFPSDRIMLDRTIKPGQESPIGGHGLGLTAQGEGDSIGYRLLAVLFADGTFIGAGTPAQNAQWAQTFQNEITFYREYGRSMKTAENRGKTIYEDANLPRTSVVGVDLGRQRRRRSAGKILNGVLSAWGADALDHALDRLASLPDVKGGN